MPQGIEAWDASGRQTISITNRFTRFLGYFYIPIRVAWIPGETYPTTLPELVHSGSYPDGRLGQGHPFVIPVCVAAGQRFNRPGSAGSATVTTANCVFSPPEFVISATGIQWTYDLDNTRPVGDPSEWFVGGYNCFYGLF